MSQFPKPYTQGDSPESLVMAEELADLIHSYFHLKIGGKEVPAPYYINTKRKKDLRALMGKGTPAEMELEAKVWAQVKGFDLNGASIEAVREFMYSQGIGIDCSGLVYYAYTAFLRAHRLDQLSRYLVYPDNSLRSRFARWLRPELNTNVCILTSAENTEIVQPGDVLPGDLLRIVLKRKNGYHIGIVESVTQVGGTTTELVLVQSARQYGKGNGMRRNCVKITKPSGSHLEQDWTDEHYEGRNYLLEELEEVPTDSGFRRFKFLDS